MAVRSASVIREGHVYVPACDPTAPDSPVSLAVALDEYVRREFLDLHTEGKRKSECLYMVPRSFSRSGDSAKEQADNAEEVVYKRLQQCSLSGVVFHARMYAKKRDNRLGMTFKEHDFVFLEARSGKLCILEVKSCADDWTEGVLSLSKGKSIADNRRSGMHQLQGHTKFLQETFGVKQEGIAQCMLWPYLSPYNSTNKTRFLKDTEVKHAFADVLRDQSSFNEWLQRALDEVTRLDRSTWIQLLEWFIVLSCGVVLEEIEDLQIRLYILLSQEQLDAISREPTGPDCPLVIDGPAGSGKSLLILLKLTEMHREGLLTPHSQALILCGRKCSGMEHYIKHFLLEKSIEHVTVERLPISHEPFQAWCEEKQNIYTYVFMDAAEDITWYGSISKQLKSLKMVVEKTPKAILWLLTDGNQLVYNLAIERGPVPGQKLSASVRLTNIYRTTGNIFAFNLTLRLGEDDVPLKKALPDTTVHLGHSVEGPPVFFLELVNFSCKEEAVCALVAELCGRRGIRPNDLSVVMSGGIDINCRTLSFDTDAVNKGLQLIFCGQGFIPQGLEGAQNYYSCKKEESFYVGGSPDYKGLEAQAVIVVMSAHPCTHPRMLRKRLYTMSSRSRGFLCLLWDNKSMPSVVDKTAMTEYHIARTDQTQVREFFSELQQQKERVIQSLKHEEERLKTFDAKFSEVCTVSGEKLAKDGFVSYPRSGRDGVQCVFCGGILYDWEAGDTARGEHQKFYSSCPFLMGHDVGNIPNRNRDVTVEDIYQCREDKDKGCELLS